MATTTKAMTVRLAPELVARMDAVRAADGVPASDQIRRALGMWLTQREQFNAQLRKSLALAKKGGK